MRVAALIVILAIAPLLAACEQNPLEDWAYHRTAATAPEQEYPSYRQAPAAARTVDTAPLHSLQPQ